MQSEALNRKQRELNDEIARQRDSALDRAVRAERAGAELERSLGEVRETASMLTADRQALEVKLEAREQELRVLQDVHAKAAQADRAWRDVTATLHAVGEAAGVGEGEDLVMTVRQAKQTLDNLKVLLADLEERREQFDTLLGEAGSPTIAAEDEGPQPPAEAISVGDAPAAAEAGEPEITGVSVQLTDVLVDVTEPEDVVVTGPWPNGSTHADEVRP
jgi:hypothetical protein